MTNFDKITPCGECCEGCAHIAAGECKGCRETGGRCVKMWTNGCDIFKCCTEHNVHFCGLCEEFPCKWLEEKIGTWNPDGIENLKRLRAEYLESN